MQVVIVNGVAVLRADLMAGNGVIHMVDQVLLPPENNVGNLAEVLSGLGFSQLVDLVVAAGLADTVSNGGTEVTYKLNCSISLIVRSITSMRQQSITQN